jgi:hypothetical protein
MAPDASRAARAGTFVSTRTVAVLSVMLIVISVNWSTVFSASAAPSTVATIRSTPLMRLTRSSLWLAAVVP